MRKCRSAGAATRAGRQALPRPSPCRPTPNLRAPRARGPAAGASDRSLNPCWTPARLQGARLEDRRHNCPRLFAARCGLTSPCQPLHTGGWQLPNQRCQRLTSSPGECCDAVPTVPPRHTCGGTSAATCHNSSERAFTSASASGAPQQGVQISGFWPPLSLCSGAVGSPCSRRPLHSLTTTRSFTPRHPSEDPQRAKMFKQ